MAIAEAKLLGQGVMLPSSSKGGNYAISRVAPYTITSVLWGNDSDRFHQAVIVKGDPLTPAARDEMKAKWAELKGTGTYEAWAKSYLAGKGYELNDVYTLGYTSDPTTWDALATSQAADAEAIVNTYDGLLEASNFIATIQKRQGLYVSCIEEIAWRNGWLSKEKLLELAKGYKTDYGRYLEYIAEN